MRISDWSSDVCSSDLPEVAGPEKRNHLVEIGGRVHRRVDTHAGEAQIRRQDPQVVLAVIEIVRREGYAPRHSAIDQVHRHRLLVHEAQMEELDLEGQILLTPRSEEHTSELQSLMRISYAVFCLKKKKL